MEMLEIILWFSLLGLAFIYIGYGLLVTVMNILKSVPVELVQNDDELPTMAILIAAYNEEDFIQKKIENTLALNYPEGIVRIYVVTDGSNDRTNELVAQFEGVTLLYQPARRGKTAAINRSMPLIGESITVFTDANVMISKDALREIVKHYNRSNVGGVSGEKVVMHDDRSTSASTEGLYWKYESYLKKQDALLCSIAGAAGELFSIRTKLFEPLPEDTLLDDFAISLNVIRKGYNVKYEPAALAFEHPSANIDEEYKRKVRIAAGGLQTIFRSMDINNPFRYGIFSFQYIFHRISRWTVAPVLIVAAFICNLALITQSTGYLELFAAQVIFHALALVSWYLGKRQIKVRGLYVPFYFDFMHYCVVMGWLRYFKGNQKVTWQKATRLSYN